MKLATALAASGFTDAQIQPDGRLAVVGVEPDRIAALASEHGITLFGTSIEHVDLEQVFLAITAGQYTAAPQNFGAPQNLQNLQNFQGRPTFQQPPTGPGGHP